MCTDNEIMKEMVDRNDHNDNDDNGDHDNHDKAYDLHHADEFWLRCQAN